MLRWVVIALVAASCGPIVYVNEVTRRAADKVDEARAAEADKYAPYYWTRANEYYNKAREVAAYADFQGANAYGRLASEAAERAIQEAALVKADPSKGPLDQQVAPAKAPAKEPEPPKEPAKPPVTEPAKGGLAPAKETK
jgi:hypothetical protein